MHGGSEEPAREQHRACQEQANGGRQDWAKDARHRGLGGAGCGDLPQGCDRIMRMICDYNRIFTF